MTSRPSVPPPLARPMAIIGDTAGEQVRVDEVDELLLAQADRVGQEDRDDDGARVEREDVLEAVDGELRDREDLVDGMLRRSRAGFVNDGRSGHVAPGFLWGAVGGEALP